MAAAAEVVAPRLLVPHQAPEPLQERPREWESARGGRGGIPTLAQHAHGQNLYAAGIPPHGPSARRQAAGCVVPAVAERTATVGARLSVSTPHDDKRVVL